MSTKPTTASKNITHDAQFLTDSVFLLTLSLLVKNKITQNKNILAFSSCVKTEEVSRILCKEAISRRRQQTKLDFYSHFPVVDLLPQFLVSGCIRKFPLCTSLVNQLYYNRRPQYNKFTIIAKPFLRAARWQPQCARRQLYQPSPASLNSRLTGRCT